MKRIIEGKEAEVEEIEPVHSDENWNIYQMPNEEQLRIKIVPTIFYRAKELTNNKREPIYSVDFQLIMRIIKSEK